MISNLKHEIEARASKAAELSWQVEKYIASGGRYSREESKLKAEPPKRSDFIDPDTVLKRRKPSVSAADRRALRAMADSL